MSGYTSAILAVTAVAGAAMSASSTIAQGNAAAAQAQAQQQALEYQAKQKEVQAGQERAASQRNAQVRRKEAELAASRGLAVSAASGGGALDPTVVNILGDIEGEGEYQALMEMYGGEQRARNLESGAALNQYEGQMAYAAGQAAKKNSRISAAGQFMSTAGQLGYSAYKGGMFSNSPGAGSSNTILDSTNRATPSMYSQYG
jgi:hypothetical protein